LFNVRIEPEYLEFYQIPHLFPNGEYNTVHERAQSLWSAKVLMNGPNGGFCVSADTRKALERSFRGFE
jgi:hypothetical protein